MDAEVLALGSQYRNIGRSPKNTFTENSHGLRCIYEVKIEIVIKLTSQWEFSSTFPSTDKPIIIHRTDIEQLLAYPKKPRNQLIHELAALMGFRTGEITVQRREWINLETGRCYVKDSKKRELYPIPLNYRVAKLIAKVVANRTEGLLIRRFQGGRGIKNESIRNDEALTGDAIWQVVRDHAKRAGIQNWRDYNPRLLRHYFAASFAKGKDGKPGNMEVLRRIMRHTSLMSTQVYLARLIFFEDVQEEYDRIHTLPIERKQDLSVKKLNNQTAQQCLACPARSVCKYVEEAINAEWASGCRFYAEIMAEAKR